MTLDIFERYLKQSGGNKVAAGAALAAGLMQGDKVTFKQGYSLGSALMAVTDAYNLTRTEVAIVADRIAEARKPLVLITVDGGLASHHIYRGEADVHTIDWDNIEAGSLTSNLDEFEAAGHTLEALRELEVDRMDQEALAGITDTLSDAIRGAARPLRS